MYCSECGIHLPTGAKFCPQCGHSAQVNVVSPAQTTEDETRPRVSKAPTVKAPSFKIEYSTDYQQVEANRQATALGCSTILLVPSFLFSVYYFDSWWAVVFWTVVAALVGGGIGAALPQEEIRRKTRKYVRTPTCLKCGGVGDAVAVRGDLVGFRCLTCGHHWTARKGKGL
jgi:predicted RNA-binding Zn-ribbon protein involved in translation (DUF1610 family)